MKARCTFALALATLVAPGCYLFTRATVGVDRVGARQVQLELDASALTGPQPSSTALLTLHFFGLQGRFERDPEGALVELHRRIEADPWRDLVYGLAELCYLTAKRTGSREHYLAAAVYAYLYLLDDEWSEPPNPYDRRFRWACELYNRGLREALLSEDRTTVELRSGRRGLPVGFLEIEVDRSNFPFLGKDFEFFPADDFAVWGLSLRVRDSGLGVPLVARAAGRAGTDVGSGYQLHSSYVPATGFLHLAGGLAALQEGCPARLELRSAYEAQSVRVGEHKVPLESDFSATLAHALHSSNVWKFSLSGLFEGGETLALNGIKMVQPYQPGRIPVIFVHGTASNPGNWAEMFNMLEADRSLREHYQFWFYLYSTGNPIPFSAAKLRAQLEELLSTLDPQGQDPALQRIVLVGHSQGGLLAKLLVVDGDIGWWEELTGTSLSELGLSQPQEELLRSTLDFDPLPCIDRVVFIATPHRGSFLADRWFSRLVIKMISLPGEMSELSQSLFRDEQHLPSQIERRIPTSIDNMKTDNPFLLLLARTPLAPWITADSIIPIGEADPGAPGGASDGVVKYASAHLEGVASETLVSGGHSCQDNPEAIRAVRRILREHLADLPAAE